MIISDDLTYPNIFNHLKSKCPNMNVLNIFSDGARSQFKQEYLFSNLHLWEEEHDLKMNWNFFATSHGKGVVDGIGGTVKRAAWRHIRSNQAHVTNVKEYADVA